MAHRHLALPALGCALAVGLYIASATPAALGQDASRSLLTLASGRVSIAGTSNIHAYTASSSAVRVTRVKLASGLAGPAFWEDILKPGALEAFDIAIPAETLTSPKEGLDKNMHKALKTRQHPEITFRLLRIETGAAGALKAIGLLTIAGVEREVALAIATERKEATLAVKGEVQLLMTDYGIAPPKAMLGMLKTDPKVTVTFETVLAVPLT
jgi:hypothetical protein